MDLNSSDLEIEPEPPSKRRFVINVDGIIARGDSDRLRTKAIVKGLQFGRGARGTRYLQDLWVQKFETYRVHGLHQQLDAPFTGDDIIRFFEVEVDNMNDRAGRPVGEDSVISGYGVISSFGTFKYPNSTGYGLSSRDAARFKTWLDDTVKAGRLYRGKLNPQVSITFVLASRLVRAYLLHYVKNGTTSWDRLIARAFSIVLIVACASRVGDITRSQLYNGIEYAKYNDMVVTLGIEGTLLDLTATFTIRFEKEHKDRMNDDRPLFFSVLRVPAHQHMCPIIMLFEHALRHGLVVGGSTIEAVLRHTATRPDRKVQWKDPDLPLLPAFTSEANNIKLHQPAPPLQMRTTVKLMGLIANILTPVNVHALRHGAAKDYAHLSIDATANMGQYTRQGLGHSRGTEARGVTDAYAGALEVELYTARVSREFVSRNDPGFSEQSALATAGKRVTADESRAWLDENEPGAYLDASPRSRRNMRKRASHDIHKERHKQYLKTAQPVLEAKTDSDANIISGRLDRANGPRERPTRCHGLTAEVSCPDISINSFNEQLSDTIIEPTTSPSTAIFRETPIDPQLLQIENLDEIEVDPGKASQLEAELITVYDERYTDDEVIHMQGLSVDDETGGPSSLDTATSFLSDFSRINVYRNTNLLNKVGTKFLGEIPEKYDKYVSRGNSRDPPTLFMLYCSVSVGCKHFTASPGNHRRHEETCTEEYVAREQRKIHVCTHSGCSKAYADRQTLAKHLKDHEPPVTCPKCPDTTKTYTSTALTSHMRDHHGKWPTACRVDDKCSVGEQFSNSRYKNHLIKVHNLNTTEERSPYMPRAKPKKVWHPAPCGVNACNVQAARAHSWKPHLLRKHNMSEDEAELLIATRMVDSTGPSAKRKRKSTTPEDSDDDDNDDDND